MQGVNIVKGVAVNYCKFYVDGFCNIGRSEDRSYICSSENNNDCYYKQLIRTQAQYERVVEQNRQLQRYRRVIDKNFFEGAENADNEGK